MKKILYLDMDGVVVDFMSAINELPESVRKEYEGRWDEIPNIFGEMKPMSGAIRAVEYLSEKFDLYFLSTAPWDNSSAWFDKVEWIKRYLPVIGKKRLIISSNKQLNIGDYLVDDRLKNGADKFTGELIRFGFNDTKDWNEVVEYLKQRENL